ncbi:MAG: NAD(P)H-dependent oxidoreductase subunit E [Thermoguttaceae bacterium]|nr:NAD(P)H-dependent oxidoreductase subunit E [Thermoguttaceae bacterium]MDW8077549.1 NAD(P)H-dependent oxidoreductase subunit E [Thermoguttaceae bacterium]
MNTLPKLNKVDTSQSPPPQPVTCACGEASEEEKIAQLNDILRQYRNVSGALIPVLQIAQAIFGYLPEHVLRIIAKNLNKSLSEVAGVVTFYSFFNTVPRGKHTIRVCLGTACYVRGGKQILAALKQELGIDVGETTPDRVFSLDAARCFGACGLAPVIMVDDNVHQRVKVSRLAQILDAYRNPDKSGSRETPSPSEREKR